MNVIGIWCLKSHTVHRALYYGPVCDTGGQERQSPTPPLCRDRDLSVEVERPTDVEAVHQHISQWGLWPCTRRSEARVGRCAPDADDPPEGPLRLIASETTVGSIKNSDQMRAWSARTSGCPLRAKRSWTSRLSNDVAARYRDTRRANQQCHSGQKAIEAFGMCAGMKRADLLETGPTLNAWTEPPANACFASSFLLLRH